MAVVPVVFPGVELGLLGEVLLPVCGVELWPFIVPGLVVEGVAVVPAVPDWPAELAAVPVPA